MPFLGSVGKTKDPYFPACVYLSVSLSLPYSTRYHRHSFKPIFMKIGILKCHASTTTEKLYQKF